MFRMLLVVLLASLALTAWSKSASEKFHREVPANAVKMLDLSNTNGKVTIVSTSSSVLTIDAEKTVSGSSERECENLVAELKIEVVTSSDRISISHSRFQHPLYSQEIEYKLAIPSSIQLRIENVNGDVECSGHRADAILRTTNGELEISDCRGKIKGMTTNGSVKATDVAGGGEFETTNGSITLKMDLSDGGDLEAATTNGSIDCKLNNEVSAKIIASTENGDVDVNHLALKQNKRRTDARGTLGNGIGSVRLRTTNGDIDFNLY